MVATRQGAVYRAREAGNASYGLGRHTTEGCIQDWRSWECKLWAWSPHDRGLSARPENPGMQAMGLVATRQRAVRKAREPGNAGYGLGRHTTEACTQGQRTRECRLWAWSPHDRGLYARPENPGMQAMGLVATRQRAVCKAREPGNAGYGLGRHTTEGCMQGY